MSVLVMETDGKVPVEDFVKKIEELKVKASLYSDPANRRVVFFVKGDGADRSLQSAMNALFRVYFNSVQVESENVALAASSAQHFEGELFDLDQLPQARKTRTRVPTFLWESTSWARPTASRSVRFVLRAGRLHPSLP
jgi:hypothetical protein